MINTLLLDMEKNGSRDIIQNLLREAHSLKGMCATMGYVEVSNVFHELENLLVNIDKKGCMREAEENELLFLGFDLTQKYIEKLESAKRVSGENLRVFLERFESVKKTEPKFVVGNLLGDASGERKKVWNICFSLGKDVSLPGARGFVILDGMSAHGVVLSSKPSLGELKKGTESYSFSLLLTSELSREELLKKIESYSEIVKASVEPVADKQSENSKSDISSATKQPLDISSRKPTNVRVETAVLDKLLSLVEELIISEGKLERKCGTLVGNPSSAFAAVNNLIISIYSTVSDMRMFPFEYVSNRFPRAIRDLAAERNKKVRFVMSGQEIKLDSSILEEFSDPLLHIFRNAVDHGIEQESVRLLRGKPPEGVIRLSVVREKERVLVAISDDGNGVDLEKVRKKAVSLGLYTKQNVDSLSESDLLELLTAPGFSTASEVDMISGRGMGLDIVKSKILDMGGKMFVQAIAGEGTKINIELPMTVAVVQVLLVVVASHDFAIPISRIYSTAEVIKEDVYYADNRRMFDLGGDLIPLLDLTDVLNFSESVQNEATDKKQETLEKIGDVYYFVVVVDIEGKRVGLIVDSVVGQHEILVKPLKKPLEKLAFFSGVAVLGDGRKVFWPYLFFKR